MKSRFQKVTAALLLCALFFAGSAGPVWADDDSSFFSGLVKRGAGMLVDSALESMASEQRQANPEGATAGTLAGAVLGYLVGGIDGAKTGAQLGAIVGGHAQQYVSESGQPSTSSFTPMPSSAQVPLLRGNRPLTRGDARKGYVTTQKLNVRGDHYSAASVVAQAEQGASLSIVDTWNSPDGEYPWYKIDDLPDKYGWVYGKYVRFAGGQDASEGDNDEILPNGVYLVSTPTLYVRAEHDTRSAPVFTLVRGDRVRMLSKWTPRGNIVPWVFVEDGQGRVGWTSGRYMARWLMSDAEFREYMRDPGYAAAEKILTVVWDVVKARAGRSQYQHYLARQKNWIVSDRNNNAARFYEKWENGPRSTPRPDKQECYRLATLARAGTLLSQLFGKAPAGSPQVYETYGSGYTQTLKVAWLAAAAGVRVVSVKLDIVESSGVRRAFSGIGLLNGDGKGFACNRRADALGLEVQSSFAAVSAGSQTQNAFVPYSVTMNRR